jgi:hypothetical protein
MTELACSTLLNSAEKLLLIITSMALTNSSLTERQQNYRTIWGLFISLEA